MWHFVSRLFFDHRPRFSQYYLDYMRSPQWRRVRGLALARANHRCEHRMLWIFRCHAFTGLQAHHKTYARLGREYPSDVEILCERHHPEADRRRRAALRGNIYG